MTLNIANLANAQAMGWADAPITRSAAGRLGVPALNVAQGTVTTDESAIDLTATWNNAAITFEAIKANIIDTASNAASLLLDLQTGGVSRFRVRKNGSIDIATNGSQTGGGFNTNNPFRSITYTALDASAPFAFQNCGIELTGGVSYGYISFGNISAAAPMMIGIGNAIEQRNGTIAQTSRLYNTFTDASNYERGFMRWASNVLQVGTENGGTGAARAYEIVTGGVARMSFAAGSSTITLGSAASIVGDTNTVFRFRYWNAHDNSISLFVHVNNSTMTYLSGATNPLLQFGGTTSAFAGVKRSGTVLQSRLADDSGFASYQGKMQVHANAVSETITPNVTLRLFDAAGVEYRVPALAV